MQGVYQGFHDRRSHEYRSIYVCRLRCKKAKGCNRMKAEDLIVKDGSITLRSMFDFGRFLEIKRFLEACHSENCTVTFANEGIVIFPDEYDAAKDAFVFIYGTLAERHDVIEKYLRYKLILGDEKPKPTLYSQRKE
nr:MAG TPA: hypothetical protein [Caudoviricetes sp.]